MRALVLIVSASCGTHLASAWKPTDAIAAAALTACDMGQTLYAADGGRWDRKLPDGATIVELNPLLGSHPGDARIAGMFALDFALDIAVYVLPLPDWLRASVWSIDGTLEWQAVGANYQYDGVCGIK